MTRKIYLISTGGTIEKVYHEPTGAAVNQESRIKKYLERLRLPDTEIEAVSLLNKDSLEMTDGDRDLVLNVVKAKLQDPAPVVITHGTDTMIETGRYLESGLADLTAPVILTGAMTPLGFENTDGLQNLTEALFATRFLPPGVWLVMHNQAWPVSKVRKNRALAQFEAV
ncbi:MAG: asparaginase [Bryobacteraceae bacterium]|nr:asparaginase [Bryobacteraceae bacterium]